MRELNENILCEELTPKMEMSFGILELLQWKDIPYDVSLRVQQKKELPRRWDLYKIKTSLSHENLLLQLNLPRKCDEM